MWLGKNNLCFGTTWEHSLIIGRVTGGRGRPKGNLWKFLGAEHDMDLSLPNLSDNIKNYENLHHLPHRLTKITTFTFGL